jgi:mRNA interferase RelE/StbE
VIYKVEVETRARREYRDLPHDAREKVTDAIDDLQTDPRPPGATKLVGADGYGIRTGDYRILYILNDDSHTVGVYRIGHRREVYRRH